MEAAELRRTLEISIEDDADDGRTYLGMSQIGRCARALYNELTYGRRRMRGAGIRLCHEGKVHEADILRRLKAQGVQLTNCNRELVADFDDRFKGHIDGEIDGDLLELKSVGFRDHLEDVRRRGARMKDRWQVQAYMAFGGYERALIVYKVRADGDIWIVEVRRDEVMIEQLRRKAARVLDCVDHDSPPRCECGRCRA